MARLLTAAVAVLFGLTAVADDKKPTKDEPKIKGTWVKENDGFEISFTFKTKTEGKCEVKAGGAKLALTLKYEYADDKVKAEVTKVEEEGDFPAKVAVGYKMKFTVKKAGDDGIKISEYEADNADEARHVVEGEYKKKKSD